MPDNPPSNLSKSLKSIEIGNDASLNAVSTLKSIGLKDIEDISSLSGGMDTTLWRVRHGGLESVLRVFKVGQDERCEREVAAMAAAGQGGIPVPEIRAEGRWEDRPFLLLSWCEGMTLPEVLQRRPWQLFKVGRAFGRMQARIHQIAAPQAFGDKPLDWIEWAAGDDVELSNKLAQIARPSPALLHLDYHSLNVLTDGREITAVLDWANTQAGDPRADFARTYTILMVEPYVAGKQSLMLSLVRRLLTRSWRRG